MSNQIKNWQIVTTILIVVILFVTTFIVITKKEKAETDEPEIPIANKNEAPFYPCEGDKCA